jgi:hypothetical protein
MSDDSSSPVAKTRYGEISLNQLAELQPGMARLMVEISDRWSILYHAAKAGNWDMARHQLGEARKAMQMGAITRPNYKEALEGFIAEKLNPVAAAIRSNDWTAFERAFGDATDAANEMHGEFGYAYIVWQLPEAPPPHLKL